MLTNCKTLDPQLLKTWQCFKQVTGCIGATFLCINTGIHVSVKTVLIPLFSRFLNAASLAATSEKSLKREILYLLAVGHFRAGDVPRARRLINEALVVSISLSIMFLKFRTVD